MSLVQSGMPTQEMIHYLTYNICIFMGLDFSWAIKMHNNPVSRSQFRWWAVKMTPYLHLIRVILNDVWNFHVKA